jgi:hypothetical protein
MLEKPALKDETVVTCLGTEFGLYVSEITFLPLGADLNRLCIMSWQTWNLLIDGDNALYLVDWDTLIFAPKERELMFVGSGLGGNGHTAAGRGNPVLSEPIGNKRLIISRPIFAPTILSR